METRMAKNKFRNAAKGGVFGKHKPGGGGAIWTLRSAAKNYIAVRENKPARE